MGGKHKTYKTYQFPELGGTEDAVALFQAGTGQLKAGAKPSVGAFETTVGNSAIAGSDGVYTTLKSALDAGFNKIKLVGSTSEIADIINITNRELSISGENRKYEINFNGFRFDPVTCAGLSFYFFNCSFRYVYTGVTIKYYLFTKSVYDEISIDRCDVYNDSTISQAALFNITRIGSNKFYFNNSRAVCNTAYIHLFILNDNADIAALENRIITNSVITADSHLGGGSSESFAGIIDNTEFNGGVYVYIGDSKVSNCIFNSSFGLYVQGGLEIINSKVPSIRLYSTSKSWIQNCEITANLQVYSGTDNVTIIGGSINNVELNSGTSLLENIKLSDVNITTLVLNDDCKNVNIDNCTIDSTVTFEDNIDITDIHFSGCTFVVDVTTRASNERISFNYCKFASGTILTINSSNCQINHNYLGTTAAGSATINDNGTKNTIIGNITEAIIGGTPTTPNHANNITY